MIKLGMESKRLQAIWINSRVQSGEVVSWLSSVAHERMESCHELTWLLTF